MKPKEQLYKINLSGSEVSALIALLRSATINEDYSREILAVLIQLENASPVNSPSY